MKYSIVIPLKDEEDNILPLINEVEKAMKDVEGGFELILVDDGSEDKTVERIKRVNKPFLRTIIFEKNYGQSAAFEAGFKKAEGEWMITLDGDRQNDPADIPKLIAAANGADLVVGIRQKRKDTPFKRIISKGANCIRRLFLDDGVEDTGCSLKLYRKACLNDIKIFHGMHRFLPALFLIEGYKIAQVPVSHRLRHSGKTKYTIFNRSLNTLSDLLAVRWMQRRKRRWVIKEELP